MIESRDYHSSKYSEIIIRLRKEKGITAIELAAKMGVSPIYIAKIELGEIQPTAEEKETLESFISGRL